MADESDRAVFAFGTGEVSPVFAARSDVEKMSTACRSVQNMTLQVYGGAERRPGLQFISYAKGSEFALVSVEPTPSGSSGSPAGDVLVLFSGDNMLNFAGDNLIPL